MSGTPPDFEKLALGDTIMSLTNEGIVLRAQLLSARADVAALLKADADRLAEALVDAGKDKA